MTLDAPQSGVAIDVNASAAVAYAYSDGDGPWTLAPPAQGGRLLLPIESSRFGVAAFCEPDRAVIRYLARTEASLVLRDCSAVGGLSPLASGTISGPTKAHVMLAFGAHFTSLDTNPDAAPTPYELRGQAGVGDLFIVSQADDVERLSVLRNVDLTTPVQRDIDVATLDAPERFEQPLTNGVVGGTITTAMGTEIGYWDNVAPYYFASLPASQRLPTDRVSYFAQRNSSDGAVWIEVNDATAPSVLDVPADNLLAPLVVDASDGRRIAWNDIAGSATHSASFYAVSGASVAFVSAGFSSEWRAAGPLAVDVPDLRAVSGLAPAFDQPLEFGSVTVEVAETSGHRFGYTRDFSR